MEIMSWEILSVIGVGFIIFEIMAPTFYFLPIGVSFLVAAGVAHQYDDQIIILSSFAIALFLNILVFRKFLERFHQKTEKLTNFEGMIGKECEVTEKIEKNKYGYVKLYGDLWRAGNKHGHEFEVGERAIIAEVDGNKVYVESIN